MVIPITKTNENQDILEMLSDIECRLYYRQDGSDPLQGVDLDTVKETHALVKKALETWHKGTGLTL